jgi:hypothetical protein
MASACILALKTLPRAGGTGQARSAETARFKSLPSASTSQRTSEAHLAFNSGAPVVLPETSDGELGS